MVVTATGTTDLLTPTLSVRPPSPRRESIRQYGILPFLSFFFYRVTRYGPKLLLYPALLLSSVLIIAKCLPEGLSDTLASSTSHIWRIRPDLGISGSSSRKPILPPGENNAHDSVVGGGLRIVVFGENDIATSMLHNLPNNTALGANNGTSWTKEMCLELGCTTYLSYVPALGLPQRSLTSNPLYGAALDDVLAESEGKSPADDFSFVSTMYPISWQASDLYGQVAAFLDQPAPQRPPKDTVWVFSFGMWDIWSLAAFPPSTAENMLVNFVSDIFSNVETLYDAAHNTESIAYSNFTSSPLDDAANHTKSLFPRTLETADLPWDDSSSEPFRVMIPLLFDPSLVPGWHLDRPDAPERHTKFEELHNAVRLTKKWNDFVMAKMAEWTKMNVTFVHPDDRIQPGFGVTPTDKTKEGTNDKEGKKEKTAPPNISAKKRRAESVSDEAAAVEPMLYRDGTIFRFSDYIMDIIIDGQMQMRGVADKKGFGRFSNDESFLEVDKPCLTLAGLSRPKNNSDAVVVKMNPGTWSRTTSTREASHPTPSVDAKSSKKASDKPAKREEPIENKTIGACDKPDTHLFFTPFTLGQRAIEEVGRLAAAVLRADRSTRAAWEKARTSGFESDRKPASWKEYYVSE